MSLSNLGAIIAVRENSGLLVFRKLISGIKNEDWMAPTLRVLEVDFTRWNLRS